MSNNRQVTVPLAVTAATGIEPGDRFRVESAGSGRFVMTRVEEYAKEHAGQLALPDDDQDAAGTERRAPE